MLSVRRYTKMEGNREIQVHVINELINNASWVVIYRFGDIEKEEYFASEILAKQIAEWVLHQGYKLIKVASIELI